MQYMGIREASEKWGISERRIRILCAEGRVEGAVRNAWAWVIPNDAPKPGDGRRLRHLKNMDMRIGAQNFSGLDEAAASFHAQGVDSHIEEAYEHLLFRLCRMLMGEEGVNLTVAQIQRVCAYETVDSLTLSEHILLLNFRAILQELTRTTGFFSAGKRPGGSWWSEQSLSDLHASMVRLLPGDAENVYRNAKIPAGGAWGGDERTFSVTQQMETLFVQYDREWRHLHPLVRAVFLFGEINRIKPYEQMSASFALLVLAGELLAGGLPPACISSDRMPEFKATLALTVRRGNYQGTARMIEESVLGELLRMEANR